MKADAIQDNGYGGVFDGWYDRIFPKDAVADATAKRLASLHPDPRAGTLEFGVGTGRIAIPLSREVGHVVGVDSSLEMLAALADDTLAQRADVEGVHGDMRTYSDSRSYGLVYCVCGTLGMLLDPADRQQALDRAAERLAPGGVLVVETMNKPGIVALHEGMQRTSYFVPYPDPGTGLQTYSVLLAEGDLWQCHHIWHESDGTTRVGSELVRLATPEEVEGEAANAGLTAVDHYSAWDGSPYQPDAAMFVSVYERSVA